MSVILDALRKSEHERQRSAVPGLAQVPIATPRTEMPRWALVLIGALGAAVLVLGGAWWQSERDRPPAAAAAPTQVERPLEIPAPPPPAAAPTAQQPAIAGRLDPPATPTAPPTAARAPSLADAITTPREAPAAPPAFAPPTPTSAMPAPSPVPQIAETTLPSAAALAAQGIALPPLRLELHAYAPQPVDRFVFINGRRYSEGQRISEGPQVVAIAPNGAVLSHLGQRFLLSPE